MAALLAQENGEVGEESFDKYEDAKAKKSAEDIKDVNEACQVATGNNKCPDFLVNMAITKSTIYKVEIEGVSDNLSRVLTFVFDRGLKPTQGGAAGGGTGAPGTPPGGGTGAPGASAAPQFKVLYKQFR
jgi:hypothetical protein